MVGGVSLVSKRFNLNLGQGLGRDPGMLQVVGQTRLSPKQAVYLLRVGERVLILGAGAGTSPTTLGEVTDSTELARLIPQRGRKPGADSSVPVALAGVVAPRRPGAGFDQRIGDDE